MHILVVATKSPWPPIDGGRLVLLNTLDALSAAGHEITLVAPVDVHLPHVGIVRQKLEERCRAHLVAAERRGLFRSLLLSQISRRPLTIVRHTFGPVQRRVRQLLERHHFDVIHVEQQQALHAAEPALRAGIPAVVRAHNVEHLLWEFASDFRRRALRWGFRREARRLARWEGRCVRSAAATVALTAVDARHLRRIAGPEARVEVVEASFCADLTPGPKQNEGSPVVAVLASGSWIPNRDAIWRFAERTWPQVLATLPDACLHVFGIEQPEQQNPAVRWHPPPDESATAFPADAIFIVPARHPTGVPMKCLEAWARGLPVVASPEAAEQLAARDGEELMVASSAADVAAAVRRIVCEPDLRARLTAEGRRALRTRHDPGRGATRLEAVYRAAVS